MAATVIPLYGQGCKSERNLLDPHVSKTQIRLLVSLLSFVAEVY